MDSELDDIPQPAQYPLWHQEALARKLEAARPRFELLRQDAIEAAKDLLHGYQARSTATIHHEHKGPMTNRSTPWSRDEVASLVTSEIVSLTHEQLAALSPYVVALEPFATDTGPGSDGLSYWLVARDGDRVLYWDGVEEEFATAELKGHALSNIKLCGEKLEWCLPHFIP